MHTKNRCPSFTNLPTALVLAAICGGLPLHQSFAQTPPQPAAPAVSASPKPTPIPRTPVDAITPAMKDQQRHADFLFRKTEGEIGLLFLGDSITDFWPRRGESSWLKLAPYKPANFGISGDRTEHLLWRISNGELDGLNPKVTVLMIGTNNVGLPTNDTVEWGAAGVKKVLEAIREKLPQTKILLLGVMPRGATADDPQRQKNAALNKIIAGLDDGKQTRYLDISNGFLDANGNLPKETIPDGVHPNAHGYDIWYDAMHPLLEELMR